MPDRYRQYPLLPTSRAAHILLIITMLYYLPLMKREPWYEVSWGEPVVEEQIVEEVSEPAAEQASLPMQSTPVKPVVRHAPPSVRPSAPLNPPKAEDIGPPRLSESEVVEAPYTPHRAAIKAAFPEKQSPVWTLPEANGVRHSRQNSPAPWNQTSGGKLSTRTPNTARTLFGDYEEVKLSFSVDMSARLIASSIRVIQSQNGKFDAEAISYSNMTFSFRDYDPDKPIRSRSNSAPDDERQSSVAVQDARFNGVWTSRFFSDGAMFNDLAGDGTRSRLLEAGAGIIDLEVNPPSRERWKVSVEGASTRAARSRTLSRLHHFPNFHRYPSRQDR